MAIANLNSFKNCFDAVHSACVAIEKGDADQAANILSSVREDAKILQRESKKYCEKLKQYEEEQLLEIEQLTKDINDLYDQEKKLEKQEQEHKQKKAGFEAKKKVDEQSLQAATKKYEGAKKELNEAQSKCQEFLKWFWVPGYGTYLAVQELVEQNGKKTAEASREMRRQQDDIATTTRNINDAVNHITKLQNELKNSQQKRGSLKSKRDGLHQQVGGAKSMSVFLMGASIFWEEISALSESASAKSSHLQKIVTMSGKQNNMKILQSNGTKTLQGSFRECWQEIEIMMQSESIVFTMERQAIQ